ncbi:MAG: hypothetical protein AB7G75_08325 [Candidatus Binatia bacterium]
MSAAIPGSVNHAFEEQNGVRTEMSASQQNIAADPNSNNLEKIREILFGNQLHDFEGRFARLEERLTRLSADLRDDVTRSLTSIEAYVKKEIDSLNERFTTESNERNGAVKTLSLELKALSDFSWQKLNQLDEQATKNLRELRLQLLDQSKSLSEEVGQKYSELSTVLDQAVQELRTSKMDRSALASFFNEVATRLSDERRLPDGE